MSLGTAGMSGAAHRKDIAMDNHVVFEHNGERWEVSFEDDHPLGSRFGMHARDDHGGFSGYVSWTGPDLVIVLQDVEREQHEVHRVQLPELSEDWDLTPLDDDGNVEALARAILGTLPPS